MNHKHHFKSVIENIGQYVLKLKTIAVSFSKLLILFAWLELLTNYKICGIIEEKLITLLEQWNMKKKQIIAIIRRRKNF